MTRVGEVYWDYWRIVNKDNTITKELKPTAILDRDDSSGKIVLLTMELTSKTPYALGEKHTVPDIFDEFKVPILDPLTGETKYTARFRHGKVNKTAEIFEEELNTNLFIGILSDNDLETLINELDRYLDFFEEMQEIATKIKFGGKVSDSDLEKYQKYKRVFED